MLILSRHRRDTVEIFPGPNFTEGLAALINSTAPVPFVGNELANLQVAVARMIELHPQLFKSVVHVLDHKYERVKLGFDVHPAWAVHRGEIADRVRAEDQFEATDLA